MNKVESRKTMVFEHDLESCNAKQMKCSSHVHKAIPCTMGDRLNITILLFLYTLQGVPLGLTAAIPIIMQKKHITYREQVDSFLI